MCQSQPMIKIALSATRGLWRFLGASLALHLLLLLTLQAEIRPPPGGRAALPVTVALASREQQGEAQEKTGGEHALPSPTMSNPVASHARNRSPAPDRHQSAAQLAGNRAKPQPSRPGGGGDTIAAEVAVPTGAPVDGASIDAVRHYVLLLVPEARRLKRYPALARQRGWEGTTEITIRLGGGQLVPSLAVSRSSGFQVLDEEALAMIGHAVRIVAVPEPLQGSAAAIPVPIRFSLDD